MFIYVLQLEEGKYYVGKTTQPSFRIESHFHGSGSSWTKKYKPQTVLEMIPNCDSYDEDNIRFGTWKNMGFRMYVVEVFVKLI